MKKMMEEQAEKERLEEERVLAEQAAALDKNKEVGEDKDSEVKNVE